MKDRMTEVYRPNTITRDLITNEDEINRIKKSEKTNWDYLLDNPGAEEAENQQLKYRMQDIDSPATYEPAIDYYDPTAIQIETEIRGQKRWLGDTERSRPYSITVYLLANGEIVDEQRVTAKNKWAYRFTNIPVYDATGEKITYTIKEKNIQGYHASYDRYDIRNLRVDSNEGIDNDDEVTSQKTSRGTRIGLFVVGAAAITAGLLLDQLRKEK